ncbi:hypothetical protein ACHAWF_013931 [Thalassiosira exigua]
MKCRYRHIRRRAEAYASAMYYSACSLSGISHNGAVKAEENARTRSRWWLKGNDPNHPTLKGSDPRKEKLDSLPSTSERTSGDDQTTDDDDDNESLAGDLQDDGPHDDFNVPILARDDDLGNTFGTLSNFCNNSSNGQKTSPALTKNVHLEQSVPQPVSPSTTVLDKQDVGGIEEMLRVYSSYPNQSLTDLHDQKPPPMLTHSAVQVTSESEADESIYSNGSTSFQGLHANYGVKRSRKRDRGDYSAHLDQAFIEAKIQRAKTELLSSVSDGASPVFKRALDSLEKYGKKAKKRKLSSSTRSESSDIDGTWLMISPPEYPTCLGKNGDGDSLFTLGRMSFDMYQPADLICSIQKQYNTIHPVSRKDIPQYVPKSLRQEVAKECGGSQGCLRTYNIIASFTIEDIDRSQTAAEVPRCESKKLSGIMTNYGYSLSDPTCPGRKSVWFSGGTIEPADDETLPDWKKVFGSHLDDNSSEGSAAPTNSTAKDNATEADKARNLASKMLLGAVSEPMDSNGIIGFHMNKPIGGHGCAYVDIVYMDDDLRVMRGHSGSVYVFRKV